MSLDTYNSLIEEVGLLLMRNNITSQVPTFIRLFEAQANRHIQHYRMIGRTEFILDGNPKPLPCGFHGVQSIKAGKYDLVYVTPDQLDDVRDAAQNYNGPSRYYSIVGDTFIFSPNAGRERCKITYWSEIPNLGRTCQSNWLLKHHPDVYLYGAALQAAPFLLDDDRIPVWRSFVESAYQSINAESIEQQFGAHAEVQIRSIA